MRKKYPFSLLFLLCLPAFAQQNLSGSRQTGFYTYVYGISAPETIGLFRSGMNKVDEKYLHTPVDSFLTGNDKMPVLKKGNYLFVHAEHNQLSYELRTIGDLQYKLINNNRDLVIALHNRQGQLIKDADAFINNKKIPFEENAMVYRISKRKRSGLVKVYHQGVVYLFPLAKSSPRYYSRHYFRSRLVNSFPLKYIAAPFRKLFNKQHPYSSYFDGRTGYENKFSGFMVFSKPKYKPGDTVKLKAWITEKGGRPVNRHLLVRLTDSRLVTDTLLTSVEPYRPGGYEYSFVITDSLDLRLDEQHMITLEELKGRRYNLDEYDGDSDEEAYALKRKVLMRGKFEYEEYELGTVRFTARSDKEEHQRGNPVAVYLKATDENDMAVLDGRVQLLIMPEQYGSQRFYGDKLFLPDTIWNYSQPLEALGETKIIIPDSIFPAVSFGYNIQCNFLNSNNELKTQTLHQSFISLRRTIYCSTQKDSLRIEQKLHDQIEKTNGKLYAFNEKKDTLQCMPVQLPCSIIINPFVKYYTIRTDSADAIFRPQQSHGMVSCIAFRNKDSLSVQVVNGYHIPFWYTIFAGSHIVQRGYADSLAYIDRVRTPKNYFVSLQYVYAGNVYNEDYTVPFQDKLLTVQVNEPEFVYPGQKASVHIRVTNAKGGPVKDADITAYSFTGKFENEDAPAVPYLGKIYPGRRRYRNFYADKNEIKTGSGQLNWIRWSKEMGLDSIAYFRFLHPQTIYSNTEPAKDNITQLAPFAVTNGDLQPIHQIYIDEVPYYFSQAAHMERYSFSVSPGRHSLRLRTPHQLIRLDSVWATAGMKTFISINTDTMTNKIIHVQKMPDTLTTYEKLLWSKYMILVENNFGENLASITQSNHSYLLNNYPGNNNYLYGPVLTGPLTNQFSNVIVKDKFVQQFEPEGNYLFNISKGLIKQKQLPHGKYAFSSFLGHQAPAYNFHDFVLTDREVDSLWSDYLDHRSANEDLFKNPELNKLDNGQLQIAIENEKPATAVFIKNILLFRYNEPDFIRIYKGVSRKLGYVQPGKYRLFFLLKGDEYFIKDSIEVRQNGINFYNINTIIPNRKDSVSMHIAVTINSREKNHWSSNQENDLGLIKESFNEKYLDTNDFSRYVFGSVKSIKDNLPIVGAIVTIKGTRFGTTTDKQGMFRLKVPARGILVFESIGYEPAEKRIMETGDFEIKLKESVSALNEIVVVGYTSQKKKELTGAVSSVSGNNLLAGKTAGIAISIRGFASMDKGSNPIVIMDGIPFSGKLEDLDQNLITNVIVLTPERAMAIYGARGSSGVIFVTSKKNTLNSQPSADPYMPVQGNLLRKKFRDEAFWQPHLRTDTNGIASFNVTFPDDITNWRSFFIVMGNKKQTGFSEKSIKSLKLLSANLSSPSFAVEDDSMQVFGKTLNYMLDTVRVKRLFTVNDRIVMESDLHLRNAIIDSFMVTAGAADSLKLAYTIKKQDGYFDGEERSIPVFKKGVLETKGLFAALKNDTLFYLQFDTTLGKIKLHASSSILPVLLDEIENIHSYEHLCNEQLASKLKALLLKKRVYSYLHKDFSETKNITGLITRLGQTRSQAGLWGWWNSSQPASWISLHVIESLLMAEKEGFKISLNKNLITDYLVYNLENYTNGEQLASLYLLQDLEAKADFKKYIDTLEKHSILMNMHEKLKLLQLKQRAGIPVSIDYFREKYNITLLGNLYWGEDNISFFDNAVQNTLLMYRLMKSIGGYESFLQKMRNYFLEKRNAGHWRNTYESSLILETILPDLLQADSSGTTASISINKAGAVKSFPFSAEVTGGKVVVDKKGAMPVYFTAYQQNWNSQPAKISGDFEVNSFFEKGGRITAVLKAGELVTMKITVKLKSDADYVMIEVPVPAGCSYNSKEQSYINNEVHREFYKNKVSIFCNHLSKGAYTYTISLLPRYPGSYTLNPARAELMYFPVFYGRESMKRITIE